MAKQMAKEGRKDFHVSMDVTYRNATIKDMEIDLGSPLFSGKDTVSEALVKYAKSPEVSLSKPLSPQDIHTFETMKWEELAYAEDYEHGDAIRGILNGELPIRT